MASSRASAVLDSLMGREDFGGPPPARRTLFSRAAPEGGGRLNLRRASGRRGISARAAVVALVIVAAVVGVGLGWSKVGRPVPIEDRMPLVGEDGQESAGHAGVGGRGDGRSAESADKAVPAAGSKGQQASSGSDGSKATGAGSADRIVVHIAGAVISPGVVTLGANSRVVDAVTAAGGLRPDADPERVNLAELLTDGVRIVVPAVGQDAVPEAVPLVGPSGGAPVPKGGKGTPAVLTGLVNLNTATAADLEQLPGVGPATSAAIIAKRDKDGPFRTVDSLLDVRGIGEAKLDAIRDLVTVG